MNSSLVLQVIFHISFKVVMQREKSQTPKLFRHKQHKALTVNTKQLLYILDFTFVLGSHFLYRLPCH